MLMGFLTLVSSITIASCSGLEEKARATTEKEAFPLVKYNYLPSGLSKYDDGGVVCYILDAPKGAAMQCFKK
jgi:hypothetical protein